MVRQPVLLTTSIAVDSHMAGLPVDFFGAAADAAAAALADTRRATLEVQGHVADPAVRGPNLRTFSPADATAGGILDVVPRELPAVVETSGGATEGGPVGQRSLVQQLDGVRQPPRMEQGPDGLPAGGSGHQRHSVCVVGPAEEQSP